MLILKEHLEKTSNHVYRSKLAKAAWKKQFVNKITMYSCISCALHNETWWLF